ncbi:MAG TPA: Smr/MutS family protein [Longimicrobiales bacterium]|nr:Smr/MutS family protein [Longimicrobiales bacterium]
MSRHALEVLEFDRVLDAVAERASTEAARERLRRLRPSSDRGAIERALAQVGAAMGFVEEEPAWGLPTVPDARAALQLLAAEGAVLEPVQLHQLGVLLRASRLTAAELDAREHGYPELAPVRARLVEDRDAEVLLERSVDAEGQVLDTASKELRRVRDRLRGAHARVVRQLESYMRSLPERYVVTDASVTIRDGRYVIPIRREGRGEVGGIVHDESHTGATLFVEPPIAMELMNQLRDLEREEGREIRRVLGALSDRMAPSREGMAGALDALVELDGLLARARTALAWRASVPELLPEGERALHLVDARHPRLLEAAERPVVPYDLDVLQGERAVVVSGPNTGGKSVFLKATGLICALAQSGVVPPVGPGTRLPLLSSFFADIGDEQSIAQSLSTFSAHVGNLADILRGADERSLVLIDEMGTGTDPAEGAALAQAMLEALVSRGALTLVSSHLGQLKQLAGEGTGIVNASLQFDPDRMEPTYRLVKGRPGRSYGLAIARRLGFPPDVLDRAEGYLDSGELRMEELLEQLERRERDSEAILDELRRERAETARLREELEGRARSLSERERSAAERAREDARKLLMDARSEVEEAIEGLRAATAEGAALEEAARDARRRVETAAARARPGARGAERAATSAGPLPDVAEGDRVRVRATGARGRVLEVRDARALVEVGALRLELPLADLDPVEEPLEGRGGARAGGWTGPTGGQVRTEIDLRGLRVEEVDVELIRALDEAVLEDLSELRVIHGKGTGALRKRVGELLEGDARVAGYRMGGPTEGGAGVTVVSLS